MTIPEFKKAWRILASRAAGWGEPGPATARRLDALGREAGFTGPMLALGAHLWAARAPLAAFGTPAQRRRFQAALKTGRMLATAAVSEADAGSDVLGMRAAAKRERGGYRIVGRKRFVTGAPAADLFLVWARTAEEGRRADALSCFLVPARTPGARVKPARWTLGPAGGWTGELELNCRIAVEQRLGDEGQGLAVFHHAMELERRMILAPALGAMERRLAETVRRARARRQFGRPLSELGAVAQRLAGMRIRLDAARALLYSAAETRAGLAGAASAGVKTFVSEAWVRNCLDAVQLGGGEACLSDRTLERELSAAVSSRLLSGGNELLKSLIAAELGAP